MPSLTQDQWIQEHAATHPVSELEDCAVAVEASYYLQLLLHVNNGGSSFEPLLPALGAATGMEKRIEDDLDQWEANKVTPFFVFDGQTLQGQDEVSIVNGRKALETTNEAWTLYFRNETTRIVKAFGSSIGTIRPENFYHLLQSILRKRKLHFLVAPYNAAAQIAYFDMIDSDQCGAIMGSDELLLYPINDCVIKTIDWDSSEGPPTVTAVSKKHLLASLGGGVSESLFVDSLLARGTSFLPQFPGMPKDRPTNIRDVLNMLRTENKSVHRACETYAAEIRRDDSTWEDKYMKAALTARHPVYIAESGEIRVHDYESLHNDNFEYLGYQLPAELFHYLNTGLIGSRNLTLVTHLKCFVLPTVDGYQSPEYERLVESQTRPIKENALALITAAMHRYHQHRPVPMRLWYRPEDEKAQELSRAVSRPAEDKFKKWTVKEAAIKEHAPQFSAGSIASELLALRKTDLIKSTHTPGKGIAKGINSADSIISLTIWRFLHLRDYVNDAHTLTNWGNALATAMEALKPTVDQNPEEVGNLYEALFVAFELIRFDILHSRDKHDELQGYPLNGTEQDQACLLLISRCATLLELRHEPMGYTGPLSKSLLHFRSLASEVRSADRDLTEAIVALNFMRAQSNRERDDYFEIGHRLPFLKDPHVALGIAVKTYFDDIRLDWTQAQKDSWTAKFCELYCPFAIDFQGDLAIVCAFFNAIHAGIKTLEASEFPVKRREEWDKAAEYLKARL